MKPGWPKDPAIWFLLGALVASVPWTGFLTPPVGLPQDQLAMWGIAWRTLFFVDGFTSALAYAMGLGICKVRVRRRLSAAVGALFGLATVVVVELGGLVNVNSGPLLVGAAAMALVAGLAVGLKESRARDTVPSDS